MQPSDCPVRFSNLKNIAKSPAHYLYAIQENRPDTVHFRKGRLTHALVLDYGIDDFVVYEGDRRGKDWKTFAADNASKDIVTQKEYDIARRIADSVRSRPSAMDLIRGAHEVPIMWRHETGRECSSRIDVLGDGFVTELKTTRCAHPDWFRREALRLCYHAQLAWYRDAANTTGAKVKKGYIVAVESVPPFEVTTWEVPERTMAEGQRITRAWVEQLLVCEDSNCWPGYCEATLPLEMPDLDENELVFEDETEAA